MNEVTINIGGKDRVLKGTIQNIMDIEAYLQKEHAIKSILQYIEPIINDNKFQPSYKEAAHIIYYGLNGNNENRLQLDTILSHLANEGIVKYTETVALFLGTCLSGSKKNPIEEVSVPTV